MSLPQHVKIVEVGPRDGLQNEKTPIATAVKLQFIDMLADAGLKVIEATAFVSPKWVPQMADHGELMRALQRRDGVRYPVLVPNMQGYQAARAAGVDEIAVFAAASEAFSQKNINCSIEESLARFAPVVEAARQDGVAVRGYVSCVMGCPYQGEVPLADVRRVAAALHAAGCYEVSLGDAIGAGTPELAKRMSEAQGPHQQAAAPSAIARLDSHERWLVARLESVRALKAAYAKLYAVLDENQRKVGDQLVVHQMGIR